MFCRLSVGRLKILPISKLSYKELPSENKVILLHQFLPRLCSLNNQLGNDSEASAEFMRIRPNNGDRCNSKNLPKILSIRSVCVLKAVLTRCGYCRDDIFFITDLSNLVFFFFHLQVKDLPKMC